MHDLYPEVETTDIRDRTDLLRYTREYEHLHKVTPNATITGYMEDKNGVQYYCNEAIVTDCKGRKFTVALPDGFYTLTIPEHENVTITLTTLLEE